MKKKHQKKGQASEQNESPKEEPAPSYHIPVLLNEVIEQLNIEPDGIYVDCTFGGGGHSLAILKQLSAHGRLVAFDQDADARRNLPADDRLVFIAQNFRHLGRFLRLNGFTAVHGILADLGVSSHQFDEPARGFSTRFEAALDMRMDQRQEKTAVDLLRDYPEEQLHRIFEQYGEVTNARTLARTIVEARKTARITTIEALKRVLSPVVKGNPNKYLAQVFQALRIEVNDEMGALKEMLEQVPQLLLPGGRIVVITFHSLEDRLVKTFFRDNSFEAPEDNPFVMTEKKTVLRPVHKKPITAGEEEMKKNPRSRSAKLRVAEKI